VLACVVVVREFVAMVTSSVSCGAHVSVRAAVDFAAEESHWTQDGAARSR